MVFSSPIFIFLFLPVVLGCYFLVRGSARNFLLLAASLLFYLVGEGKYTVIMLVSIGANYIFALLLETPSKHRQKIVLSAAIALNIGMLLYFKYANFIVDNFNHILGFVGLSLINNPSVHLPIGISFFTFQALSYVVDVYRGEVRAERKPARLAVYISLFPQLIAGPIVRYTTIASELKARSVTAEDFAEGIKRFIIGLSKKMLIANSVALTADQVFSLPSEQLTFSLAWLGIICYSLQLYFDFSGYSDMAIGLGRIFGFHFLENFNYPYVAQSVREFWRRWHISLSTWFRDYLYIPLGGSRGSRFTLYRNLIVVYFLTGLWHGANWTFIAWGMFHGLFLILERMGLDRWLSNQWRWVRHMYLLLIVMIGWVFFRAETFSGALDFIRAMFGLLNSAQLFSGIEMYLSPALALIILIGILASGPLQFLYLAWRRKADRDAEPGAHPIQEWLGSISYTVALTFLLILSLVKVAADTYNPFIYFRF